MQKCIMTIGVLITIIAFCLVPQALDGIHIRVCIVPILIVLALGDSLIAWAVIMKNINQSEKEYQRVIRHCEDADKQQDSDEISAAYQKLILNEIWQ